MVGTKRLLAGLIAVQVAFTTFVAFADERIQVNIELRRAARFLDAASEGLSKLVEADKAKVPGEWADKVQQESADICMLVQERLEKENLNGKDVPLCSNE